MRHVMAILLALMALFFAGMPEGAGAAAAKAEDGKLKVAMAGRQRMLTQRLAKSVCLKSLASGFEAAKDARIALEEFEAAMLVLEHGDAARGLPNEANPVILDRLQAVRHSFDPLRTAVLAALADANPVLDDVAATSMSTLTAAHAATGVIAKFNRDRRVHPAKAASVNIAGRQRMLTQKMAKEACFIAAGHDEAASRNSLGATLVQFNTAMTDLIEGHYEHRIPAAPPEIGAALIALQQYFAPTARRLSAVASGAPLDSAGAIDLARKLDLVLAKMQAVVEMY